jgi:Putative rhamnosyl transferase
MNELRLLVFTRFGVGIEDPLWFEHRIKLLAAITAPSLSTQDDQNFTWIVQTDDGLPKEISVRLWRLVTEVGIDSCVISTKRTRELFARAKQLTALESSTYSLSGRIDDDDGWHPETVGRIRGYASSWLSHNRGRPGAGWSFSRGLEWIMYDMKDFQSGRLLTAGVRDMYLPFTSISVFVLAGQDEHISALSAGHTAMRRFLADRSFDVSIVDTEGPMWLYSRHKQADSAVVKAQSALRQSSNGEIEQFGVDSTLLRDYRHYAASAPYVTEKGIMRQRRELTASLQDSPDDDEIKKRLHRLSVAVTKPAL